MDTEPIMHSRKNTQVLNLVNGKADQTLTCLLPPPPPEVYCNASVCLCICVPVCLLTPYLKNVLNQSTSFLAASFLIFGGSLPSDPRKEEVIRFREKSARSKAVCVWGGGGGGGKFF